MLRQSGPSSGGGQRLKVSENPTREPSGQSCRKGTLCDGLGLTRRLQAEASKVRCWRVCVPRARLVLYCSWAREADGAEAVHADPRGGEPLLGEQRQLRPRNLGPPRPMAAASSGTRNLMPVHAAHSAASAHKPVASPLSPMPP